MDDLTRRQRQVLEYIQRATKRQGYPPSVREIMHALRLASPAGIHKHIKALAEKGYLSRTAYLSRSLRVTRAVEDADAAATTAQPAELVQLPLEGYVAAGAPIEAVPQGGETLPVPAVLLGSGSRHYVLRVRGNSMVEEGILDGDHVILEARQTARNGEVVVALLHGQEATLKRFFRENGTVRLQPANATMAPIVLDGGELRIQGVVVGIWRRF